MYIFVFFGLIFILILIGMCLLFGLLLLIGWVIDLFGGWVMVWLIYFICVGGIVLFIVVYLVLVVLVGLVNEIWLMIIGKFCVLYDWILELFLELVGEVV